MDVSTNNDLIKQIKRYQHCLQQINPVESDSHRVLHCIRKLSKLPIKLNELETTGIGKTINGLRKSDGHIAQEATLLVTKWKSIVKKQVEEEEAIEDGSDSGNVDDNSPDSSLVFNHSDDVAPEPVLSEYDESMARSSKDGDKKLKQDDDSNRNKVHLITIKKEGSHDRKRKHSEEEADRNSRKEKYMKVEQPEITVTATREPSVSSRHHDIDFAERKVSSGDKKKKDRENDRKSRKKDHEKRHHKSSKYKEEKSHRESKHEREDRDKQSSHHEKKRDSDDKYNSHKHKRDKKSKIRDKDEQPPRKSEKDRKSSKESLESNSKSKKSASREMNSYKHEEISGDDFGAALLGIPTAMSPKRKSTSSKSSYDQEDSPPTFSSPKSNNSLDFLSNNVKLEPLSKDLDLYEAPEYAAETYGAPSKHYSSKYDEHISPSYSSPLKSMKAKAISEEEMFSSMASMKNRRTKVYHGTKVNSKCPTLFELCIRILQDNFEALEYTGGVPFEVLKPILEKVTAQQLFTFENFNPYLIGETDELWKQHAKKHFRSAERQEYETWRDLYMRCMEEREEKLQSLTENITQSIANSTPVRKTKLAFVDAIVKPPRNVARQQARHGTGYSSSLGRSPKDQPSPSAVQSVKERLTKEACSPNAIQIPTKSIKKKAAPLMQKTLQLFKGLKR